MQLLTIQNRNKILDRISVNECVDKEQNVISKHFIVALRVVHIFMVCTLKQFRENNAIRDKNPYEAEM